ncbi:MAG: DEAD/DEAH box helicase [Candidatus Eisenbacteria bacterium]|nr:DEAD/DEAH box helicase [Candidatus Eisenbacteria bacterium]
MTIREATPDPEPAAEERRIRGLLPRTGSAFFGRFRRLSPIQRAAIPRLLDGTSLLIIAPTATGKTEAIAAPLVERYLAVPEQPAILYIAPTRALVNDVFRRLEPVLERLQIGLARKSSDHPSLPSRPPQLLITTPESLDSLLVRRPRYLLAARALVLDELHTLSGTSRGDQLAALVPRLERIVAQHSERQSEPHNLQIIAASATVDDPRGMAARYLGTGAIVKVPGQRTLPHRIVDAATRSEIVKHLSAAVGEGFQKILAFANSRSEVELLAAHLRGRPPFGQRVFAHHGSLSRGERERVEMQFLNARRALCVATLTLELGIDIGDVDGVLLLGPPPSVSALLQRTGRAGRRGQAAAVMAAAFNERDELLFEHLFTAAEEGELLQDPPIFDPSVTLQQALSICLQNRRREVDAAGVLERMPGWQQTYWSEERLRRALQALEAPGWLEPAGGGVFKPGPELEEAHRRGTMHANIARDGEVLVWDDATGRVVGSVAAGAAEVPTLALGATSWDVARSGPQGLHVTAARDRGAPIFSGRGSPLIGHRYAARLKERLGIPRERFVQFETARGVHLFHALGSLWGELYRQVLGKAAAPGPPVIPPAWGHSVRQATRGVEARMTPRRLQARVLKRRRRLVRLLPFGPLFTALPPAEQDRAVLTALRIEEFLEHLRTVETAPAPKDLKQKLSAFITGTTSHSFEGGDRT